jgi:hypothetical protein
VNTMGMTVVVRFAARAAAVPSVTITSTLRRTNSAAISAYRAARPSPQRYFIVTVRPSIQPNSRSRCMNAATSSLRPASVCAPRKPMVASFPLGCCARAARGHAAAAPPSSPMNSRRFTAQCLRQETAALRDFDPAYDRSGSKPVLL